MTLLGPVILTLNAGSSSLKFAAFALADGASPSSLASGQIEGIGATARGDVKTAAGEKSALTFDPLGRPVDHRGRDARHPRLARQGRL